MTFYHKHLPDCHTSSCLQIQDVKRYSTSISAKQSKNWISFEPFKIKWNYYKHIVSVCIRMSNKHRRAPTSQSLTQRDRGSTSLQIGLQVLKYPQALTYTHWQAWDNWKLAASVWLMNYKSVEEVCFLLTDINIPLTNYEKRACCDETLMLHNCKQQSSRST